MGFPTSSTASPNGLLTYPAIVPLPTAAPNCNSPIESPTDTPATENCKNKSFDNIENNNDRPDDDNDNDNDVDCFPRQDKQPVPPQDISPTATNNTPPSLIESFTDKSTNTDNTCNNIKNNNDRPDDDDDDDDDDVDCFPRQDKQPVLPQDISPTAPTANATDTTSPSLLESLTDKSTDTDTDNNNNNIKRRTTPARTKQTAYRRKPTHTVVPQAPLLVWDGTQYQLDYNDDHRPISTWDGTTHTDIVYDDDDDYNGTNDYAYGDPFNMNDPSNQLQFTQRLKTVQFNNYLRDVHHIDTSEAHASTASHTASHNNRPKQTHDDETNTRRSDTTLRIRYSTAILPYYTLREYQ